MAAMGEGTWREVTDGRCRQDHQREGQVEEEQRDNGSTGEGPGGPSLQRSAGDAQQRLDHHHQHRAFQPKEEGCDEGYVAQQCVDQRQHEHHHGARQDEGDACRQPAPDPVHDPAKVGGQLLRLGPGQQRDEVQCVQEALLTDPVALVDHLAVQQRDLARGSAEG
jgi:hypothetical protein